MEAAKAASNVAQQQAQRRQLRCDYFKDFRLALRAEEAAAG